MTIPPIPSEAVYVDTLNRVSDRFITARKPVNDFIVEFSNERIRSSDVMQAYIRQAQNLGLYLEPRHDQTGLYLDSSRTTTNNVAKGAAASVLVIEEVHGDAVQLGDIFENLPFIGDDETSDPAESKRNVSLGIVQVAKRGISLTGEKGKEIIEDWALKAAQTQTMANMFKVGMGIGLFGAYRTHEINDVELFKSSSLQALETLDWDEEIAKLSDAS